MPTPQSPFTEQDDDDLPGSDEIDESSDPFLILAAREEAMGTPLYFMSNFEVH